MIIVAVSSLKMNIRSHATYIRLVGVVAVVFIIGSILFMDTKSKRSVLTIVDNERRSKAAIQNSQGLLIQVHNPHELYHEGMNLEDISRMFFEQRNNLSRILNLKQQKLGQLECEVSKFKTSLLLAISKGVVAVLNTR